MKFGQTDRPPETIDFTLPPDHPDTAGVLKAYKKNKDTFQVYVGCAKWNRQDLKGFYPRGTKDELTYYATQFNSIELNATFYNSPDAAQVESWKNKTPDHFRFYPKIPQTISHYKRLLNVQEPLEIFCNAIRHFDNRLGIVFLQLNDNFKPKDFDRLDKFVRTFPREIPLAVEVRNEEWFTGQEQVRLFRLLQEEKRVAVIVDAAGRRDMLHQRLTSSAAFIRYVGANHPTDYTRLDDWLEHIRQWREEGLQSLHFFIHQHVERESPLLAAYFIKKLNRMFGLKLKVPEMA